MKKTINITIEAFGFSIKEKGSSSNIDFGQDPDFYNIISDKDAGLVPFVDNSITGDVPAEKRTVRIPSGLYRKGSSGRYICGILETGIYGKRYELADKDNPKKPLFVSEKTTAIIKPFFYYIKIPRKGDKALMILERTDNEGIYPLMKSILVGFLRFSSKNEREYSIAKENIVTNEYMQSLQDGRCNSISMNVASLPQDISDRYFGNFESESISLEFIIKFKRGSKDISNKSVKKILNSQNSIFSIKEFNDIFEKSERKMTSSMPVIGGKSKTRTLYMEDGKQKLIRPYYDLGVEEGENGYSDFESIKKEVDKFISKNKEFSIFD